MSFVRLRASTGAISVGRRVASYAWGSWNVTLPDDAKVDESLQEYGVSPGYVSRLHDDEDEGLFDRLFVRADAQIDLKAKITTVDKVLKAAEKRTEGDVYFERDITGEDLGMYVPGIDYEVGDTVDVLVYGKLLELPVTAITSTGNTSEHQHYTVHVGGNMVSDAEALAEKTSEVERAIAEDRKKLAQSNERIIKSVNTAQSTADTARNEAGAAQSTADTARTEAKTADDKAVAAQSKANSVGTDLSKYKTSTNTSLSKLQRETRDLYSTTVKLEDYNSSKEVLEKAIENNQKLTDKNIAKLKQEMGEEYTKKSTFLDSERKWQNSTQGKISLALTRDALNAATGVPTKDQAWVNENQAAINQLQLQYNSETDVFMADTREIIEMLQATDTALAQKDLQLEKQQNSMNLQVQKLQKQINKMRVADLDARSLSTSLTTPHYSENYTDTVLARIQRVPADVLGYYVTFVVDRRAIHSSYNRTYQIWVEDRGKNIQDNEIEGYDDIIFRSGTIFAKPGKDIMRSLYLPPLETDAYSLTFKLVELAPPGVKYDYRVTNSIDFKVEWDWDEKIAAGWTPDNQ